MILVTCYCASISWSSELCVVFKIDILKNFAKFIGKHLCWSIFFNKMQAWGMQLYQKWDSNTDVFLWMLRAFLRTPFLQKNVRESASTFLFQLFSKDLLIFLTRFWFDVKKWFLNSLSGYFERLCFFIYLFLIYWVIVICFWSNIFSKDWGSSLSWFLRQLVCCG